FHLGRSRSTQEPITALRAFFSQLSFGNNMVGIKTKPTLRNYPSGKRFSLLDNTVKPRYKQIFLAVKKIMCTSVSDLCCMEIAFARALQLVAFKRISLICELFVSS